MITDAECLFKTNQIIFTCDCTPESKFQVDCDFKYRMKHYRDLIIECPFCKEETVYKFNGTSILFMERDMREQGLIE